MDAAIHELVHVLLRQFGGRQGLLCFRLHAHGLQASLMFSHQGKSSSKQAGNETMTTQVTD